MVVSFLVSVSLTLWGVSDGWATLHLGKIVKKIFLPDSTHSDSARESEERLSTIIPPALAGIPNSFVEFYV